jgi:hypothetical protein
MLAYSGQIGVSGKTDVPPPSLGVLTEEVRNCIFNVKLYYAHITARFIQLYCHVDIISHTNFGIFFGIRCHKQAHIPSKTTAGVQHDVFSLTKMLMEHHNKNDTTYITGSFIATNVRSTNNESGNTCITLSLILA